MERPSEAGRETAPSSSVEEGESGYDGDDDLGWAGEARNKRETATTLAFQVCHLTATTMYDYDTKHISSARLAKWAKSNGPAKSTWFGVVTYRTHTDGARLGR